MPVVRKMEACGSSSGRTRQPVLISDSGELPSRRQILAKLAAEKEALASLKKDPMQVLRPAPRRTSEGPHGVPPVVHSALLRTSRHCYVACGACTVHCAAAC